MAGCVKLGNIPLATHESTNSARLAQVETGELGSDGAREKFGEERDNTEQDCIPPGDTVVQKAQVRPETRKGEVLEKASQAHHKELRVEDEDRSNGIHHVLLGGEEW